ncbi:MAG: response regulator [Phycisphaerae bacterium]|nr:response regulator [Phycisphaerae bacterium]
MAEDDLHIARIVTMWLTRNGHIVFEAPNGRAALQLVRDKVPDLLVTDVNMPVMDGIELARTCAAEGLLCRGAIVMSSRCDQTDIRDRLTDLNVVLHPKPFSPSRLIAQAEALLTGEVDGLGVYDIECGRGVDGVVDAAR